MAKQNIAVDMYRTFSSLFMLSSRIVLVIWYLVGFAFLVTTYGESPAPACGMISVELVVHTVETLPGEYDPSDH